MDDKKYVTRLMRAYCSEGSMSNYLNVDIDHGIVVGADLQPLMNANDHVAGRHVIHFGNCGSDQNPERMFRKALVGGFLGGVVADFLEDVGIMACKCKPNTPNPWEFVNEKSIVEGAPALMFGSVLTCRYGGCIRLLPEDQYPPAELTPETGEETPPAVPAYAGACEAVQAVISDAMSKISETGTAGAETVQKVQAALLVASAMPPQPQAQPHSCDGEPDFLHAGESPSYEHMLPVDERQREQNYAHNKAQKFPEGSLNEDGLIINQGKLGDFHINSVGADYGGCGAIALYNVVKTLNPSTNFTFADAIYQMEPYGILSNTYGAIPTGISHCLDKMGYETDYVMLDSKAIGEAATSSDAAIVLYATTSNVHYVAFQPVADSDESGTDDPKFKFYNENYGDTNDVRTYDEFTSGLTSSSRTELAQIGIIVHRPEAESGN